MKLCGHKGAGDANLVPPSHYGFSVHTYIFYSILNGGVQIILNFTITIVSNGKVNMLLIFNDNLIRCQHREILSPTTRQQVSMGDSGIRAA